MRMQRGGSWLRYALQESYARSVKIFRPVRRFTLPPLCVGLCDQLVRMLPLSPALYGLGKYLSNQNTAGDHSVFMLA